MPSATGGARGVGARRALWQSESSSRGMVSDVTILATVAVLMLVLVLLLLVLAHLRYLQKRRMLRDLKYRLDMDEITRGGAAGKGALAGEQQQEDGVLSALGRRWPKRLQSWHGLLIRMQDVQVGKLIGCGANSTVREGVWKKCVAVAVKTITPPWDGDGSGSAVDEGDVRARATASVGRSERRLSKEDMSVEELKEEYDRYLQGVIREVALHASFRHPNVLPVYGVCLEIEEDVQQGQASVVQQLAYCNLRQLIRRERPNWHTRVSLAVGIARGLEYMHTRPDGVFTHRDLKPENVLIKKTQDGPVPYEAMLCDFGISQIDGEKLSFGARGTMGYLAPELVPFLAGNFNGAGTMDTIGSANGDALPAPRGSDGWQLSENEIDNRKADVFSLGRVLCDLLTEMGNHRSDPMAAADMLVELERAEEAASSIDDSPAPGSKKRGSTDSSTSLREMSPNTSFTLAASAASSQEVALSAASITSMDLLEAALECGHVSFTRNQVPRTDGAPTGLLHAALLAVEVLPARRATTTQVLELLETTLRKIAKAPDHMRLTGPGSKAPSGNVSTP